MIPKFRMPSIQEYMVGQVVGSFTAESATMNVYISEIMIDKSPSERGTNITIDSELFISKEKITVSSTVTDLNYIKVKVSDLFRRHHRELKFASGATITYEYDKFPNGSKVKVYIPDLNIDEAIVVPFA